LGGINQPARRADSAVFHHAALHVDDVALVRDAGTSLARLKCAASGAKELHRGRARIHRRGRSRRKRSCRAVDAHLLRERALVYGGRFCADFGRRAQCIELSLGRVARANQALVPSIGLRLLLHEREALLGRCNALGVGRRRRGLVGQGFSGGRFGRRQNATQRVIHLVQRRCCSKRIQRRSRCGRFSGRQGRSVCVDSFRGLGGLLLRALLGAMLNPIERTNPGTSDAAKRRAHGRRSSNTLHRVDGWVIGHRRALPLVLCDAFLNTLLQRLGSTRLERARRHSASKTLRASEQLFCTESAGNTPNYCRDDARLASCGSSLILSGASLARQVVGRSGGVSTGQGDSGCHTASPARARSRLSASPSRTGSKSSALNRQAWADEGTGSLGGRQQGVVDDVPSHGRRFIAHTASACQVGTQPCFLGLHRVRLLVLASLDDVFVNPLGSRIAGLDEVGRSRSAPGCGIGELNDRVVGCGCETAFGLRRVNKR
jgi:hypothetical protein